MERLTFEVHDGGIFVKESDVKTFDVEDEIMHIGNAIRKLAEYEDLEEQGLLLKLPCKVGDTVYTNTSTQGWYFRKENRPYEAKIVFIGINGVDNFMNIDFGNSRMLQFKFSDIGKTVFLTQAEAEEALKGMEREK